MRLFIIISVILLAGCASQATRTSSHHSQCSDYGFTKGTTEYGQCMISLQEMDETERQRKAAILLGYSASIKSTQPSQQVNKPLNCTSQSLGDTVYTDCK